MQHSFFLKLIQYGLFITIISQWISCTPKVSEVVSEPVSKEEPEVTQTEPLTPCMTFDSLSGADSEAAKTAYVLYRDNLNAKRFDEALAIWKQAYYMAPGSNGKVKSQFDDGVTLYKHFFEQTNDTILKKKYVDTIMMIYDKRSYCFGDDAYVAGRKAFDAYYYFNKYVDTTQIFTWFMQNADAKGDRSDYFIINPFSKMVYDKVMNGSIPKDKGLHYAKLIIRVVENGIKNCKGKECETWKIIESYAPVQMELLEGVEDFYDCNYYIDKYIPLVKMYPDSCELINIAFARLYRGGCSEDLPEFKELAHLRLTTCEEEPRTPGLAKQGYDLYQKGKYRGAIEKFESYAEESKESEIKAKYYLLISKIYYGDLKNFPKSRQYALKAAGFKPGWGEPYMLIGKLYASSGPLCGPGTGWDSQVVTWVAIDKFQYAKSIDPAMAAEANTWINRYSQYMPKKEDIFFRSISQGDKYFVACWIQEETRVRTAD